MQNNILTTKEQVVDLEQKLEEAKGAFPLKAQAIIDAQIALESKQDGLQRLEKLAEELFPAGSTEPAK